MAYNKLNINTKIYNNFLSYYSFQLQILLLKIQLIYKISMNYVKMYQLI